MRAWAAVTVTVLAGLGVGCACLLWESWRTGVVEARHGPFQRSVQPVMFGVEMTIRATAVVVLTGTALWLGWFILFPLDPRRAGRRRRRARR